MYEPLTAETVIGYVRQSPVWSQIFQPNDTLNVVDLAEGGNINLIFRVHSVEDPSRSILVKQALPHSRRYPEFKMPLARARLEYDLLALEEKYCPGLVPKVYHYDAEMYANLMEDLNQHLIMRLGLAQGITYPKFAQDIGIFMARTLFYTSDFYLDSATKKEMVAQYLNPVLCKVTEDLFFTQPCMRHPNNRWTKLLDPQVEAIYTNESLLAEMLVMKEKFMTQAQALVHGDLHTGSVLLNEEDTRFIDPEFAFFGPMAFDVGSVLGNLIIGYAVQEYYAPDAATRHRYRQWILETLRDTWTIFETEFRRLYAAEANQEEWPSALFFEKYMRQLFEDTIGNAAAEMFRRTIGLAWVDDFVGIEDEEKRATAESLTLNIAEAWLLKRGTIASIEGAIEIAVNAQSSYPS